MYSTDLDVQVTQVLTANFIRRLKRGAWKFSLGQCWTVKHSTLPFLEKRWRSLILPTDYNFPKSLIKLIIYLGLMRQIKSYNQPCVVYCQLNAMVKWGRNPEKHTYVASLAVHLNWRLFAWLLSTSSREEVFNGIHGSVCLLVQLKNS